MCGRYAFDDIKEIYEARAVLEKAARSIGEERLAQAKQGEVFPTDRALVLRQGAVSDVVRWGYPMRGSSRPLINARCETLGEKPMFRGSLSSGRCLVPCSGFFEWQKTGAKKQKMRISPMGERFFYLAGLVRSFNIEGVGKSRFVIVTTAANAQMSKVHHRMPLIVKPDMTAMWLTPDTDYLNQADALVSQCESLDIVAV